MSPLDASTRLQRTKDEVHTVLDGSVIVMTLADGHYFELNPVGARIWDELQEPTALPALVEALTAEYDIEPAACRAEVEVWLARMQELGLVFVVAD
jgi:hypothetical protein